MRATTAFNKMLAVPGADVVGVTFTPAGIIVDVRRRARRLTCPCGWSTRAVYDRVGAPLARPGPRARARLFLQAEIRRLDCRACGRVRTETVPWARPAARFTRDFEDVLGWLAQRMDKTAITRLLRCSWEAVAGIVARVVADHLDDARLDQVYRIGVDEVSYRKGHRYLTVVADHDRDGAVDLGRRGQVRRHPRSVLRHCSDPNGCATDSRPPQRTCTAPTTASSPARAACGGVRRPVPRHQAGQRGARRDPPLEWNTARQAAEVGRTAAR